MTKRRGKSRAVVKAGSAPPIDVESLPFSEQMIFTERGFERAGSPLTPGQSGGIVHVPQFMNLSGQTLPPKRGTRELQKVYSESPWLRAIVSKIARGVADTCWVLYAKKNSATGRYMENTELVSKQSGKLRENRLKNYIDTSKVDIIEDHPMLTFLETGTGNPRLNGFSAMEVTQKLLDLVGEAFWLIEPDEFGMPIAYWPLPASWVQDFPTNNNPFYLIQAPRGLTISVPATLIVPFIDPDPDDPYGRGSGIAKSLDDEIQIDEYSAKHSRSFFLNRARPDIIISGQFINAKDAERLEKQWMSDHQGFWKAFKPLFFSQKIDVKELSQTFESMQMVQLRKYERDTFVNVFGIPPEKIGLIGESKRSTIQAADMFWTKDVIKPRIEMIRRVLQQVVVPRFDERLILYYETPVLQEDEFKLAAMKIAPWATSLNEWRQIQGWPSLGPEGDVVVVPLNSQIIPIKNNGKPIQAIPAAKPSSSGGNNDQGNSDNADGTDNGGKKLDAYGDPIDDEDEDDIDELPTKDAGEVDLTKSMYDREERRSQPPQSKELVSGIVDEVMQSVREALDKLIP